MNLDIFSYWFQDYVKTASREFFGRVYSATLNINRIANIISEMGNIAECLLSKYGGGVESTNRLLNANDLSDFPLEAADN